MGRKPDSDRISVSFSGIGGMDQKEANDMKNKKYRLLYFLLLIKRFFKKPAFLLLLMLIPLLVFGMKTVSEDESGIMHVALYLEEPEDPAAQALKERLTAEPSVIKFTEVRDESEGRNLVQTGKIDALWVIRSNYLEKLLNIVEPYAEGTAPIKIIEQEDTVVLQLTRVKLFGAMYYDIVYPVYQDFVKKYWDVQPITEKELFELYQVNAGAGRVFQMAYENVSMPSQNYIVAPLRGMLAILIVLAGLAADMFYLKDISFGVLDMLPDRDKRRCLWVYELAAMLPVAVAVVFALACSNLLGALWQELLCMALFVLDSMVFCCIFQKICGSAIRLGACIPFLMLGMLVICPVFFTIRNLRVLQYLLPPYYYLNAVNSQMGANGYPTAMLIYAVTGLLFLKITDAVTWRIPQKKR